MESETRKHKNFIGYEYKEIEADPGQVSFLIDGYENFGWEIDENVMQGGLDNYPGKNSPGKKKAVPGFLGWGLPYFLYRMGVRKQTEKMTPLIEEKYDEIYEICEKGSKLL